MDWKKGLGIGVAVVLVVIVIGYATFGSMITQHYNEKLAIKEIRMERYKLQEEIALEQTKLIKAKLEAGELTLEEYNEFLENLKFDDHDGRGHDKDKHVFFDGKLKDKDYEDDDRD